VAITVLPAAANPEDEVAPTAAFVTVDGQDLFQIGGTANNPAERRAREIARRIVAVARDRSVAVATVRAEPTEIGMRIVAGAPGVTLLAATETDAAREGITVRELSELYLGRVRTAIASYREVRTPARLVRAGGWALLATALLVGFWHLGRWGFRRLDRAVGRRLERGVEKLRIQSFRLLDTRQTWRLLRTVLNALRIAGALVLLYAYLNTTLGLFPWTRGFARGMLALVVGPLITMGRSALAAVPDLMFLIVLVFVTRIVLRLIRMFFEEIERGAVAFENFDPDWAMPTYRLVRILVVAFAVVVAFPYIPGSDTGAFKGVSLFVGVLFSLGSSSIIGNVIAGYTMTYRRAFRDGDRVRIGDVVGDVTHTRLLVTHVRTPKNEDVVIPNSIILASHVVNYSAFARKGGVVLHTAVGIGYETPWRQVEAMLVLAAGRTEGLLREPAPFVLQTALGDFAVTYELNAYCDAPEAMPRLYSALHANIQDVFNEYAVQIMTPAYEADTPDPKIVPRERWHAAPAKPPDEPPRTKDPG